MNTRLSRHALTGALCAAALAGCSAGQQFAPRSDPLGPNRPVSSRRPSSRPHARAQGRSDHRVSPDLIMMNFWYVINGQVYWWYFHGVWIHGVISGVDHGSNLGGSTTQSKTLDVAMTTVGVYSGKKLVTTLTGLNGVAAGVGTNGTVIRLRRANSTGAVAVEEFAKGATTPTATYSDPNHQHRQPRD